ncbi:MAG: methyltransferase domain-containing protein [Bacteroidota bacterium]
MKIEDQVRYYQERAKEYDLVYEKPERQVDLCKLKTYLPTKFEAKHTLEIACGTGYWTKSIAKAALSVSAIDINESVLEIAKTRLKNQVNVTLSQSDYQNLSQLKVKYDALFGGFIWSHIPLEQLENFLSICLNAVKPYGIAVFIDNRYIEGNSTPICRVDDMGNSYQIRKLQSGATFEVIKNYPTVSSVRELLKDAAFQISWKELEYYWILEITKHEI